MSITKTSEEAMAEALRLTAMNEEKTLVIREGIAPEVPVLKAVELKGNLRSVSDYLMNENRKHSMEDAVIEVDNAGRSIRLTEHPGWPSTRSVIAQSVLSSDHTWLGLLTPRSVNKTRELLRGKRRFFRDPEDFQKLANALNGFQAKINKRVSNQVTQGGNSDFAVNTQLTDHEVPAFFVLNTELLTGFGKREYRVDIFMQVEDSQVNLWFESDDAADIVDAIWKEFKEKELPIYRGKGLTVIEL